MTRNKIKILFLVTVFMTTFTLLSGCLKTRAQLKDEDSDAPESKSVPVANEVKEVKPQGQYVLDEIKSEITRLTGRIEDLEHSTKQGTPGPDAQKQEKRITELEQAQATMIETIKKLQATVPVADSVELFEKGRNQFQAKDFTNAIEAFSEYLKAQKAKFAEDAHFLRGESYFQQKLYKKAILDFSKFPEKFMHSKKLPAALYKIGLAFEALGMKEDAKGFFQEIVDKYPKSSEAKKAKAKIK